MIVPFDGLLIQPLKNISAPSYPLKFPVVLCMKSLYSYMNMIEKSEIDRVFRLQKSSYSIPSASDRIASLKRLGREVLNHVPDLERALKSDLGRNATETNFLEIIPFLEELRF